MAEPETQTEEETVTSEFSGEVKADTTDADVTDATIENGDEMSTKYESTESEATEDSGKKRSWMDEGWARRMKSYAESRLNPEKKDEQKTATSDVARLPGPEAVETTRPLHEFLPLDGFQLEHWTRTSVGLDQRGRTRIWESMREKQPTGTFQRTERMSRNRNERLWPSAGLRFTRDAAVRLEIWENEGRKRNVFSRDPPVNDEDEFVREQRIDFANRKELGHVRVPVSYPISEQKLSVDRAVGERPGLVDGDYVIVELPTKRVYAYVVLRGIKGMHLLEMNSLRERVNTWKFCFYQAVVALLAKTQFRYKYVRSANIDYIYDQAWMLFTHTGTFNVMAKHHMDDIVVYNYKYSVEIELIQEVNDVVAQFIDSNYKEGILRRHVTLNRKDPLQIRMKLGYQKVADSGYMPVHEDVEKFEEWFGKLIARYSDCIFRTTRFSLAFWRDGLFWYLYNPYRCDEYGFWDDNGHACIVKFCSADSLRRHIMILLLRGHTYKMFSRNDDSFENDDFAVYIDVQIFHVSFHYCHLDNPKLLQRGMSKQPRRVDDYPLDSLETEDREDETDREKDEKGDQREPRERATWLRRCRATTWGKCAAANWKKPDSESTAAKARWHVYYVEEPNRLFSLWGEIHITDDMFDEANRGMQAYACYVVCAGMTMITAPEYWNPVTLDAIVICGDRYYTRSKHEAELESVNDVSANHSFKYLSDRFEIGRTLFDARMLPAVHGRLYAESDECLWRTLERVFSSYRFAVLTCESVCLGLFKFCGAYYMCDVNSFGPPLFRHGHGAAYLLRATSFRKFVTVLVLTIGSPERSQFSLNPIEILSIVEMDTALESRAKTREKSHRFERFAGEMLPGKLPRFAIDIGQKKRGTTM